MTTSLQLSKKFSEAGFKGESEMHWYEYSGDNKDVQKLIQPRLAKLMSEDFNNYPAYDIANDLLIKYAKEVFGELPYDNFIGILGTIVTRLQAGKKEEAEEFLWANSILNPENL